MRAPSPCSTTPGRSQPPYSTWAPAKTRPRRFKRGVEERFSPRRELYVSLPRNAGKTTLCAGLALFELMRDPKARIFVAAAARDQAQILVHQAEEMVRRDDFVRRHVTVTQRELRHKKGGVIRALSADKDTTLGLIPSLIVVDELGAHPNNDLYWTLRSSVDKVPTCKVIVISHAAESMDSALGKLEMRCLNQSEQPQRDGVFTRTAGPSVCMLKWSLPADWSLDRAAEVKPAPWWTLPTSPTRAS